MNLEPVSTKQRLLKSANFGCFGAVFSLMMTAFVALLWTATPENDFLTLATVVVLFLLIIAAAVISVVLFFKGDPQETFFLTKKTRAFRSRGKTAVAYNDADRRLPGDVQDEEMQGPQKLESVTTPGCTGLMLSWQKEGNLIIAAREQTHINYVASATVRRLCLTSVVAIRPATFGRNMTSNANGKYHAT